MAETKEIILTQIGMNVLKSGLDYLKTEKRSAPKNGAHLVLTLSNIIFRQKIVKIDKKANKLVYCHVDIEIAFIFLIKGFAP